MARKAGIFFHSSQATPPLDRHPDGTRGTIDRQSQLIDAYSHA
jgi:hypothetical protein